jgi:hypothetical protein
MRSLLRYILNEPTTLALVSDGKNITGHPNNLLPNHVYNRRQFKINTGHVVHRLTKRGRDPFGQITRKLESI